MCIQYKLFESSHSFLIIGAVIFATENQIHSTSAEESVHVKASGLETQIMPGPEEWDKLQSCYEILVQQKIVIYIEKLQYLKPKVLWHVPHKYSAESAKKSKIVSISVKIMTINNMMFYVETNLNLYNFTHLHLNNYLGFLSQT